MSSLLDASHSPPATPGKLKPDKTLPYLLPPHHPRSFLRFHSHLLKLTLSSFLILILFLIFLTPSPRHSSNITPTTAAAATDPRWVKKIIKSARPKPHGPGLTVLVTGAAGFVGTHVSVALKRRGDGVVGLAHNRFGDGA